MPMPKPPAEATPGLSSDTFRTPLCTPFELAPPMAAGSASGSVAKFLRMFDGSYHPVPDHTGYLSTAELRLISEWLDIGAQYYNDPFVAPAI